VRSEAAELLYAILVDQAEKVADRRAAAEALAWLDDDDGWEALQRARSKVAEPLLEQVVSDLLVAHLEE
jgi:hypothetical protein